MQSAHLTCLQGPRPHLLCPSASPRHVGSGYGTGQGPRRERQPGGREYRGDPTRESRVGWGVEKRQTAWVSMGGEQSHSAGCRKPPEEDVAP